MNQLLGFLLTVLSILTAAITSGFRLKPYMDAGEKYTPMSFAVYPAAIALAITVPLVLLVRRWQGKKNIDVGPINFPENTAFIVLGCLLYIFIAITFFPYQPSPTQSPPLTRDPQPSPLPGTNISVF
ncbi:MAG: hypothetical protein AB7G75_15210 [Candidatus Binatia bacterium]